MRFHARSLLGASRIVKRWGMSMPDVFERAQKGGCLPAPLSRASGARVRLSGKISN